jgi:glycosyltransferase involved in cell wall biosynthesis
MIDNVHILIPVYNEEKMISEVVLKLKKHFSNIVVVNDGSTDSTLETLSQLEVVALNHFLNLGQGAAISTGINYIKNLKNSLAVITFDADGQHSVNDAVNFANEIVKCDEGIIFGSRFLEHKMNIPTLKRFVLSLVTFLTNKLTKMNLTDTHNGLKAYKKSVLKDIDITIDGFAFESEIINIVSRKKISYKEMSTNTLYTEYSKNKGQKLRNGLVILEDLFKSINLK